ncbi:MAG: GspE/PulE family protein [Leptospirales bacterium]
MTFIEVSGGRMEVISAPDGDLPAPDPISEYLVGLEDGRLFVLEDLRGRPEFVSWRARFSEWLATSGRDGEPKVAWLKDPDFRKIRSKIREVVDPPPISDDEASPFDTEQEPRSAVPEEALQDPDGILVPDAFSEKVVLFPDGRLFALEELRGRDGFDRFVREYSMGMDARGKIGQFQVSWVTERSLRNLRQGKGGESQNEDYSQLLADLELDADGDPSEEESSGSAGATEPDSSQDPDPAHVGPEKNEAGPSDGIVDPESGPQGVKQGAGTKRREENNRGLRKKEPDLPAPSRETPGQTAECLSSPSGGVIPDFRASDDIASMVLLFLDGRFYVSREHKTNQHVNYYCRHFVPELWPKIFGGKPVPKPQYVSYENLRKIRLDNLPEEAVTAGYKAEGDEARKIMEIILDAIAKKASDIHLRVERDRTRILYRIHGWLKPVQTLTHDEGERLARIVYNTMLDSAGRDNMFSDKKPQDGQFRQDYLPRGVFNIREFHAPTGGTGLGTITMVLRLQYGSGTDTAQVTDIDTLGYDASHLALLRFLMGLSHGIVLFSGPMGSGKSTSMAAVLSIVLAMHPLEEGRGLHLATLEDPPEYVIPTASQIAVPGGLFSEVLGRIMRFDANILMIGEIRDEATAEKAIEGAMSGHVVYSTVHANDVLSIPRRLDGLKVRRDLLCDPTIFRGMVCQRLIPLLCPDCKIPWEEAERSGILRPDLSKRIGDISGDLMETTFFHHAGGCENCDGQGVVGRTIVAEILIPDQDILDMISGGRMTDAGRHFREKLDGRTMMDHALDKIREGLADPRDVEARLGWIHQGLLDHRTVRGIVGGFS